MVACLEGPPRRALSQSGQKRGQRSHPGSLRSVGPRSASRVEEHLVAVHGHTAAFPVLVQIAELLRHLLIEGRLGGLCALLRVEERHRKHLSVRSNELQEPLIAGKTLDQRADNGRCFFHGLLCHIDVDTFEAGDSRDHHRSFRTACGIGPNLQRLPLEKQACGGVSPLPPVSQSSIDANRPCLPLLLFRVRVSAYPFTTPSGTSWATRRARPARSTTSTTRSTSL